MIDAHKKSTTSSNSYSEKPGEKIAGTINKEVLRRKTEERCPLLEIPKALYDTTRRPVRRRKSSSII